LVSGGSILEQKFLKVNPQVRRWDYIKAILVLRHQGLKPSGYRKDKPTKGAEKRTIREAGVPLRRQIGFKSYVDLLALPPPLHGVGHHRQRFTHPLFREAKIFHHDDAHPICCIWRIGCYLYWVSIIRVVLYRS
jgi:hypothetical protein